MSITTNDVNPAGDNRPDRRRDVPLIFYGPLFILTCLFMLICREAESQQWQNICSPGVTYYSDSNDLVSSFRRDSVTVPSNSIFDSIYWSYRVLQKFDTAQPCFDTTNGSLLGRKIYRRCVS